MTATATAVTLQGVFDIVYRGLAQQRFERAVDPLTGSCRYRATNGHKCAVGHLIADRLYTPVLEGHTFNDSGAVADAVELSLGGPIDHLRRDLTELQDIHDDGDPDQLQENLIRFATRHGLTVPSLDQETV